MTNDRPATPPNIDRLNRIREWHDAAMSIFDEMYQSACANLIKRNYSVANAAVHRKYWRDFMSWQFGIHWSVAQEIENSLINARIIRIFGGYAVRTERTS